MRMYTFPFFADPALFDFVAAVAANGFPQPRLFVLAADAPTLRPEHLLARLPVYYGRPVLAMYDDAALKQLTGYSTAEALRVSGPVFAIGGRSPVFGRPGSFLTVLHGWGLNFESKATDDYRRFVRDGRLAEPEAGKEISRRVWLWASAAASLAGSGNGGGLSPRARLCLPAIGFGAFLSALPNPAAAEPFLRLAFTRALAFAASALGQTLSIELRDHSGVFSAESALLAAAGVAHSVGAPLGDLFRDPGGAVDAEGNVLVRSIASGEGENGLERLVLLNAWDDRRADDESGRRTLQIPLDCYALILCVVSSTFLDELLSSPLFPQKFHWQRRVARPDR